MLRSSYDATTKLRYANIIEMASNNLYKFSMLANLSDYLKGIAELADK